MEKSMYIGSGPAQQVPMEHAYEAFRLRCRSQNLSPETCTWYKYRLGLFSRFLESKEISDAREITPHFIRLYLDHLRVKGTCSGTVARDYGALKCFFGRHFFLRFFLRGFHRFHTRRIRSHFLLLGLFF
ncbi:MAG: hypothetical protein COB53_13515 [Elusimicrobia bacterium]|nr:MAG: hypothetical protein COB53_13515 [Elusimicrobiota bacterium]